MTRIRVTKLAVFAGGLLAVTAFAQGPVITALNGNGVVSWTHPTNGVREYRIEWAADISSNAWTDLHLGPPPVLPSGTNLSTPVPMFYRVLALGPTPTNMVYIPGGSFRMGNTFGGSEGYANELPVHSVYVSPFYLDKYEVTKALWDEVASWATANGYYWALPFHASGTSSNHPAQTVWHTQAALWCNARSQREGLTPVYYVDAALTDIYDSERDDTEPFANWTANGYRLPTEAEWEKAARGGQDGERFPWGNAISHYQANFNNANGEPYAYGTTGYHPAFTNGTPPSPFGNVYSSPAGTFAPNAYGLYDMAGNVFEWCWDWYSSTYYSTSPNKDPRGPASGEGYARRVVRGGSWGQWADGARVSYRYWEQDDNGHGYLGFRCARSVFSQN